MSAFSVALRARAGPASLSSQGPSHRPRAVRRAQRVCRASAQEPKWVVSRGNVAVKEIEKPAVEEVLSVQNPSLNEPVDPKLVVEGFDDDTKMKGEVFMCQVEKGEDLTKNFDIADWRRHERIFRYVRQCATIFQSEILAKTFWPMMFFSSVAAAVCGVYTAYPTLPLLSISPFSLSASMLALLLVFRTNQSYARFDDARKLWGLLVNRTRDLNRQVASYFPASDPQSLNFRFTMQRWTTAFVRSLKVHLREGRGDLANELKDILRPEELSALLKAPHKPIFAMQVLGETIRATKMDPVMKGMMDNNLTAYEDAVGGCERILRTPLPLTYTRHTTRFLVIWLALLPISLWPVCGWLTIPTTALIAFCMLGVEKIGVMIEEPFTQLPLGAICATIQANMLMLVDLDKSKPSIPTVSHGILEGAMADPALNPTPAPFAKGNWSLSAK